MTVIVVVAALMMAIQGAHADDSSADAKFKAIYTKEQGNRVKKKVTKL